MSRIIAVDNFVMSLGEEGWIEFCTQNGILINEVKHEDEFEDVPVFPEQENIFGSIKQRFIHNIKDKFDLAVVPEVAIPSQYICVIFLNFGSKTAEEHNRHNRLWNKQEINIPLNSKSFSDVLNILNENLSNNTELPKVFSVIWGYTTFVNGRLCVDLDQIECISISEKRMNSTYLIWAKNVMMKKSIFDNCDNSNFKNTGYRNFPILISRSSNGSDNIYMDFLFCFKGCKFENNKSVLCVNNK